MIKLRHNDTGEVLHEAEVETCREAVISAVQSKVNLCGVNLSGADLSGADLGGADLSGADLSGADLGGADLSGADLGGADLSNSNLDGADLYGVNLCEANLDGASLSANLRRADLHGAILSRANLHGANLARADLTSAFLHGANLDHTNLYGADLAYANLLGVSLRLASYSVPQMFMAQWGGVSFELCYHLMQLDAECLPNGAKLMDKWAKGGACPLLQSYCIKRVAHFTENRDAWNLENPPDPVTMWELWVMLAKEKGVKISGV